MYVETHLTWHWTTVLPALGMESGSAGAAPTLPFLSSVCAHTTPRDDGSQHRPKHRRRRDARRPLCRRAEPGQASRRSHSDAAPRRTGCCRPRASGGLQRTRNHVVESLGETAEGRGGGKRGRVLTEHPEPDPRAHEPCEGRRHLGRRRFPRRHSARQRRHGLVLRPHATLSVSLPPLSDKLPQPKLLWQATRLTVPKPPSWSRPALRPTAPASS